MTKTKTTRTVTCPTCSARPGHSCRAEPTRKGLLGAPMSRNHSSRRACNCEVPMQMKDAQVCGFCGLSTEGM